MTVWFESVKTRAMEKIRKPIKVTRSYTQSGVAENDCVFVTKNERGDESIWMITRHEPNNFFVEMVKITPGETACRLQIQLAETGDNSSDANITYAHIALSVEGEKFVRSFTPEYYESMMKSWESQINSFLSSS
jgi:hypothetical protein